MADDLFFSAGIDRKQFSSDIEKMRRDILSLNKEGDKVDLSGVKDQINIQKNAISDLEKEYAKVGKQLEKMPPGLAKQDLTKEHRKIGIELENEKKSLTDLETVYKSFGATQDNVRTRQRKVRNELRDLALQGKENTDEYKELTQQLREYDEVIDSVNAQQQVMRRGGAGMQAFVGSIRAASGAFTGVTGVMGLFNEKTEKLQELQTRLQSVMSISIGVEQTYQALLKEGNLIQSVKVIQARAATKATNLQTKSTVGATVAQKAFNIVAKANPYVLLAAALVSVAGAVYLLTRRNKDAVKTQKDLNKAILDSIGDTAKEKTELDLLKSTIESDTASRNQKLKAVKELQETYPGLFGNLSEEEILTGKVADAYERATDAIMAKAKADAAEKLLQEETEKVMERRLRLANQLKDIQEKQKELEESDQDYINYQGTPVNTENLEKYEQDIKDKIKSAGDSVRESFEYLIGEQVKGSKEYEEATKDTFADMKESFEDFNTDFDKWLERASKSQNRKQTKALEAQLKERSDVWDDYYKAVLLMGRESADKMYGSLIDTSSTQLDELKNQREQLLDLDAPTASQVKYLNQIEEKIRELKGLESPFDAQKQSIIGVTKEMNTYADKLNYLDRVIKGLGNESIDLKLKASLKEESDKIVNERQETLDKLLEAQKTYDEQVREINDKYQEFLDDKNISEEEKTKLKLEREKELTKAYLDSLKDNPEFEKAFSDMGAVATEKLEELRTILIEKMKSIKDDAAKIKIGEFIMDIDFTIEDREYNWIPKLQRAFKDLRDEELTTEQKTKGLKDEFEKLFNIIQLGEQIINDIRGAFDDLGISLDNDFGDTLDHLDDTFEGLSQTVEGASTAMAGVATGNPIAVISGVSSAVGGLVKSVGTWFNNDKKKERQIKRMEGSLKRLQGAYNDLGHAITSALGGDEFKLQQDQMKNMEKQQATLQDMIDKERDKKKTDQGRIDEWQEQINELSRQQEDVIANMKDQLLNFDVKSKAQEFGDALVEAAKKGEDAFGSLDSIVDDMFENMIKKALSMNFEKPIEGLSNLLLMAGGFNVATGYGEFDINKIPQGVFDYVRDTLGDYADTTKELEEVLDKMGISQEENVGAEINSLEGAIQGMSQESADLLAGQFNAIRIDVSSILTNMENNDSYFREALGVLMAIKNDTANLEQIRRDISDLNSKVTGNDVRSSGL